MTEAREENRERTLVTAYRVAVYASNRASEKRIRMMLKHSDRLGAELESAVFIALPELGYKIGVEVTEEGVPGRWRTRDERSCR